MKKSIIFGVLVVSLLFSANALAAEVKTRSISAGYYEDGVFTSTVSEFEAIYEIDEPGEVITLKKIISNDREGKISSGAVYDITNVMVGEGLSSFMVSRDKMGQRIYTGTREVELDSAEVLIMGEDFYEYSRAANGKFYLEYGEVIAE